MAKITIADLAALRHTLQWLGAMRYVGTMLDRAASGDRAALAVAAAIKADIAQPKITTGGTDG